MSEYRITEVRQLPESLTVFLWKLVELRGPQVRTVSLFGRDEVGQYWLQNGFLTFPYLVAHIESMERALLGMRKGDVLVAQS
jgi:hypothetical protein